MLNNNSPPKLIFFSPPPATLTSSSTAASSTPVSFASSSSSSDSEAHTPGTVRDDSDGSDNQAQWAERLAQSASPEQLLLEAAKHQEYALVRWLVTNRVADVNACGSEEYAKYRCGFGLINLRYYPTALSYVAEHGDVAMVAFLIKRGAMPETATGGGLYNLFHLTASKGHLDVLKALWQTNKFEVDASDKQEYTALYYAVRGGHLSCVAFLIAKGAKADVLTLQEKTLLHLAAYKGYEEVLACLWQTGQFEIDAQDALGNTALHCAAEQGHLACVAFLLTNGAKLTVLTRWNENLFHLAARGGHLNILEYCHSKYPNVVAIDAVNKYGKGETALLMAICKKHLSCVEFLIKNGAQLNRPIDSHRTELHLAASGGSVEVLEYLWKTGQFEIDAKDCRAYTAFHCAAERGHQACAAFLLTKGANPRATTSARGAYQETVLHLAIRRKRLSIVSWILSEPWSSDIINVEDINGHTVLHRAIELMMNCDPKDEKDKQERYLGLFTLLLEHGADLYARNKQGYYFLEELADYPHDIFAQCSDAISHLGIFLFPIADAFPKFTARWEARIHRIYAESMRDVSNAPSLTQSLLLFSEVLLLLPRVWNNQVLRKYMTNEQSEQPDLVERNDPEYDELMSRPKLQPEDSSLVSSEYEPITVSSKYKPATVDDLHNHLFTYPARLSPLIDIFGPALQKNVAAIAELTHLPELTKKICVQSLKQLTRALQAHSTGGMAVPFADLYESLTGEKLIPQPSVGTSSVTRYGAASSSHDDPHRPSNNTRLPECVCLMQ